LTSHPRTEAVKRFAFLTLVCLLFFVAAAKFILQDILERNTAHNDFRNVYFAACAWLEGKQPYDLNVIREEMRNRDDESYRLSYNDPEAVTAVYPPTCLALITPLAWLPWRTALQLDTALAMLLYLGFIWTCRKWLSWRKWIYFASFALAFAPFHGALAIANISDLVVPLLLIAILHIEQYPIAAAVVLAVGCGLKPQLGALIIVHLMLSRRWKSFFVAAGTCAAIFMVGAGRLYLAHIAWIPAYRKLTPLLLSPYLSNENGVVINRVINMFLFNMQPIAYWILHDKGKAVLLSYITFVILYALYLMYMLHWYRRSDQQRGEDVLWNIVILLGFIAFYQHYYSAISLLLLFFWAIKLWPRRLAKIFTVCGLLAFILPQSKLPLVARILTHSFQGGHLSLKALIHSGLPSSVSLSFSETLAYATPYLFLLFAVFTLMFSLWSQESANSVTEKTLVAGAPLR
jgi:Glycosyltransferase family 87